MKKLTLLLIILSPILVKAQPKLVKNISTSTNFTNLNNTALFYTSTDSLWKTDGVNSSFIKTGLISPGNFKAVGNNLFYMNNTNEFWVYNNSDNSFTNLKSFNSINYLNSIGNTLYLVADDGSTGRELWKTDGTVNGTVLVKDINPGAANGFPDFIPFPKSRSLTTYNAPILNNAIYFAATNGTNGIEPWKSDGTATGTVQIANLNATGDSNPTEFTLLQNTIFFIAQDANATFFLNKTDGTASGTTLVKELSSEFCGCEKGDIISVNTLRVINDVLYFNFELLQGVTYNLTGKSDGTTNGTTTGTHIDGKIWDLQQIDTKIIVNWIDNQPKQNIAALNTNNLSVSDPLYQTKFYVMDFAWVPFTYVDSLIYFGDEFSDETLEFELCYFNTKTDKVTFIKDLYPDLSFRNPPDGNSYNLTVVDKSLFFTSNGKLWVINPNDLTVTSINNAKVNYFSIYPNPFDDKITVNSANQNDRFNINIMNLMGHSLYVLQSQDSQIDVTSLNLQQGTYLIKVSNENKEEQIIRLIKK